MTNLNLSNDNMLFFYTNLLGLDQLHDYKPEDRLAKSEIIENLKIIAKKIKGKFKKKKTLKKNKKKGGNPKRKRDTDYEIDQEESPEIKNIDQKLFVSNYIFSFWLY